MTVRRATSVRADQISRLLESVDALLVPLGFTRRARTQEWRKSADPASEAWVHLNVGKGIVNPSVGVRYVDLADTLPKAAGPVDTAMRMLGTLFTPARAYTLFADPAPLVEDLRGRGLAELARLLDRRAVVEMLEAPSPAEWPVPGFSGRIRLLPLMLTGQGRVEEALAVASRFQVEAAGRDQMVPRYEVFLDALRGRGHGPATEKRD